MIVTKKVVISGRVQGVFYRISAKQKAEDIGLTGWVRNRADGKVEAIFQGYAKKVDKMIKWCHSGPTLSKVENVDIEDVYEEKIFDEFKIQY